MFRKISLFLLPILCTSTVFAQQNDQLIPTARAAYFSESNLSKKATLAADLAWYYAQQNVDSALYFGKLSLEHATATKDNKIIAQSCNDLATVYLVKGDYKKSMEYCDRALAIRKGLNDPAGMASLYFKKANVYNKLAMYDSTINYYFKSHAFYAQAGDSAVLSNLEANISSTYFLMGNHEKALEYLQFPIAYYKKTQQYAYLANSTLNLGNIRLTLRDSSGALAAFEEATAYAKKSGNTSTLAAIYNNLGNLYFNKKQYAKAIEYIRQSIAIREEMGLQADLQSSRLTLANAYVHAGDYRRAKALFLSVRDAYEEIGAGDKLKEIYNGLSLVYAAEKNTDSLNFYQRKYDEILGQIYGEQILRNSQEIEAKYQTKKKELELARARNRNLLNRVRIEQKNKLITGAFGLAAILGITGYLFYMRQKNRTLHLQKEKQLLEALKAAEIQNSLHQQRTEISRELHDNIGAQLTFIASSIENLKSFPGSEQLAPRYDGIIHFTRDTIGELRDAIWAMNTGEMSFEDLKIRMYNFIEKAQLYLKGIDFKFGYSESVEAVTFNAITGINVYRIIQEAVHNALKHAQASEISVHVSRENGNLVIRIRDNGTGFTEDPEQAGNGLHSMRYRAEAINGSIELIQNGGTEVRLTLSE